MITAETTRSNPDGVGWGGAIDTLGKDGCQKETSGDIKTGEFTL